MHVWLSNALTEFHQEVFAAFELLSQGHPWLDIFDEDSGHIEEVEKDEEETQSAVNVISDSTDPTDFSRSFLEPPWAQLTKFLHSPWWSRLWTLQEVVLAKSVFIRWGAGCLSLSKVFQAYEHLQAEPCYASTEIFEAFPDNDGTNPFRSIFRKLHLHVGTLQYFVDL